MDWSRVNLDWRSIDESFSSSPNDPIVLRGIPVLVPDAYGRLGVARGRRLSLGAVAHACWRFISWSSSILAHLIVVIILVGMVLGERRPSDAIVNVGLNGLAGEEGRSMKPLEPAEAAPEEKKPEPEEKEPEELVQKDPEKPVPDPNSNNESPDPNPDNSTIGPNADGPGRTNKTEDNSKLIEADPTAALRERRAGTIAKLRQGGNKQIVIVGGEYDHVEQLLSKLEIPFTKIAPESLGSFDLSSCIILLINCHSAYGQHSGTSATPEAAKADSDKLAKRIKELETQLGKAKQGAEIAKLRAEIASLKNQKLAWDRWFDYLTSHKKMIEGVRKFVDEGGYLFTSDWGLTLIEKIFPGKVKYGGTVGPKNVEILPGKGMEKESMLEEVFSTSAPKDSTKAERKLRWEIDSSSYLIKIESKDVQTLVQSPEINKYPAVAVLFSAGRPTEEKKPGKVLHVLSHFYRQADNFGEYALQNLLLNFMIERVVRP